MQRSDGKGWSSWWSTIGGRRVLAFVLPLAACGGGLEQNGEGGDTGIDPPDAIGTGSSMADDTGSPNDAACEGEVLAPRLLRQLTREEYRRTVEDLLGIEVRAVDSIPAEPIVDGFDNNAQALVVTHRHASAYHDLGETLAALAVPGLDAPLISCDPSAPDCSRAFVETLGQRALRRPLEADEVDMYLALFTPEMTEGAFDDGARLVVRSLLLAPEFLYRVEIGEEDEHGEFRLTPWEIASSLSYLYWGTMPDDELFALARTGELAEPEMIAAQAERLLDDPRGQTHVREFVQQYLGTKEFLAFFKDEGVFPDYTPAIREAMVAEEQALIEKAFLGGGSWTDLFVGDPSLADPTLLAFYGDNGEERGTLLTLGTVLASHALQQESSPVRRGLFVRRDVLCQPLAPPPSDLQINNPPPSVTESTRERFEQHSQSAICASCHRSIDGLGFMLERYDGVGRFRTEDNGIPIDESGLFARVGDEIDATKTLSGPSELLDTLETNETAQRCLARRYFHFARGFTAREGISECAIEGVEEEFLREGTDLRALLLSIATERSFVMRQGGAT